MKFKLKVFLFLFLFFACSKKESFVYYESKDLLLLKLIPYDFKNLSLNEKLYIYYLSLASKDIENIRIDQIKYNAFDLYVFITELYNNKKYLNKNISDKITNLYLKFKSFNSSYYNFKKINHNLSFEDLKTACDSLLKKNIDFDCHNKLNLNKLFLFNNNVEAVLLSKYSYDPLKYSLVNLNSNDLSLFNLNTIKLNNKDAYSYFYKSKDGKVLSISFCEKYKEPISSIILNIEQAKNYTNKNNKLILDMLIDFYTNCDVQNFLDYNLVWSHEEHSFLSGFIENVFDPIGIRGIIASLILKNITLKDSFILYHAIGFNNSKDEQNILLPPENAMKNLNNNRLINPINVFNPINIYLRENILFYFYSPIFRKELKQNAVLFRAKIEEIKNTYFNNVNIDKKANKDINLKYPYLNEIKAYLYALIFIIENPYFTYLDIKNINKLILIDFFVEAILLESVFNEFNVSGSAILNNFIDVINFTYENNLYFIDVDETLFLKKAKQYLNQIETLIFENNNELSVFYTNFTKTKNLNEAVINNFKNRYFALKKGSTCISFINPIYKLINKNNKIVDVTYHF